MRTFCPALLSALLAAQILCAAEQRPDDCNAPDSKHYIALVQSDGGGEDSYALEIRSVDAEKPLLSRPAGGYANFKAAAWPANFKCLWSPDAKFVAVFERGTKRSGSTTIYRIAGDKVQEVAFPDVMPLLKPHITAEMRASWVRPEVWLPDHELLLSLVGTQQSEEHGVFRFIIILRLRQIETGSTTAEVASFQQDRSVPFSIQ